LPMRKEGETLKKKYAVLSMEYLAIWKKNMLYCLWNIWAGTKQSFLYIVKQSAPSGKLLGTKQCFPKHCFFVV
jgi:hypothetical protein